MQDSEEEREVNLRKMAEMYEDSPYKGYWESGIYPAQVIHETAARGPCLVT